MKSLVSMVVLGLLASSASAADVQISRSALAAIGLPGFVKMSDANAMAVRGKSYTVTSSGVGIATAPLNISVNGYHAASSGTANSGGASGYNLSVAISPVFGSSAFAGGTSTVTVH
jgi:hypothetical protein